MLQFLRRSLLVPSLLLVAALPLRAQESLPVTVEAVSVQRYESLIDMDERPGILCCAPFRLTPNAGEDFVHLSVEFDVAWSEELDTLRISGRDIGLRLPGEDEPRRMYGFFERVGLFATGASSLSVRRPRNWPDEDLNAFLEAVWLLPEGTEAATLVVEDTDFSVEVSLAGGVAQPASPGGFLDVTIDDVAAVGQVAAPYPSSRTEVQGLAAGEIGTIVQVTLTVAIIAPNDIGREQAAFYYADDFALVGPGGAPLPFLGVAAAGTLEDHYSFSARWQSGLPDPGQLVLYFVGNGAPGTYRLFFMTDEMAEAVFDG